MWFLTPGRPAFRFWQAALRYAMLFFVVFSSLIGIVHPFLEGLVFTMDPPHYDCTLACDICPINKYFLEKHMFILFLYAPVHVFDLLISSIIIYVVYTVNIHDNRPAVLHNLFCLSSVKLVCMVIQFLEMINTGGLDASDLVLAMYKGQCKITPEQTYPAYCMILRLWFFILNCFASVLIISLVLLNKVLAEWYSPIVGMEDEFSDDQVLIDDEDEEDDLVLEQMYKTSLFENIGPMFFF